MAQSFTKVLIQDVLSKAASTPSNIRRKSLSRTTVLALLFLYLIGCAALRLNRGRNILSLSQSGMHIQARLLHMDRADIDDNRILLHYSYFAPSSAAPHAHIKEFSGEYKIAPKLAKELCAGKMIEIVYPSDRPVHAIPVIATRDPYPGVGWLIFFAVIVLFLLILDGLTLLARTRRFSLPLDARTP